MWVLLVKFDGYCVPIILMILVQVILTDVIINFILFREIYLNLFCIKSMFFSINTSKFFSLSFIIHKIKFSSKSFCSIYFIFHVQPKQILIIHDKFRFYICIMHMCCIKKILWITKIMKVFFFASSDHICTYRSVYSLYKQYF